MGNHSLPTSFPILAVLATAESASTDAAVMDFASLMGVTTRLFPVGARIEAAPTGLSEAHALFISGPALRLVWQKSWFRQALERTAFTLVAGVPAGQDALPELDWISAGAVAQVAKLSGPSLRAWVHENPTLGPFPVCGSAIALNGAPASAFIEKGPSEGYISIEDAPYFTCRQVGGRFRFFLAEEALVNINTSLVLDQTLRPWYPQLTALAMFFRGAFGDHCWTAAVRGANFIIDDPSLRSQYGFVHFKTLMENVVESGSAVTVAFIPYNFRRSQPETVQFLKGHADRFSVAIHGCDHTAGEYASLNAEWLAGTTALALERMRAHQASVGMPYDNLMVFPQGRFSTKGLQALKACGVDAAVNYSPWPEDFAFNPLSIRDLLEVAIMRYGSFPLFMRRYPHDLFEFAFDRLFQKQTLALEHHHYFRDGYGKFREFVAGLERMPLPLRWMPLGEVIRSSCVLRRGHGQERHLRHFAPVALFRNPENGPLDLKVEMPEHGHVEAVLIGGKPADFEMKSGLLRYQARVEAGAELSVRVVYRLGSPARRRETLGFQVATAARRTLSDLRDNHLARNEPLLRLAESVKDRVLKAGKPK